MDYHLHQQGQTVGVFPLEELRRRRKAGELTGTELVWCQGMPEWQTLDTVLQREMPADNPAPPPLPETESKLIPTLMMLGVVLGGLIVLTALGFLVWGVRHGLPASFRQAISTTKRPRRGSAYAEASKPIPWTTNTLTAAKMAVTQKEFRIRQYLEPYEKLGEHNPAYDADAMLMIKTWIDTYYGGPLQTNNAVVVEMCDKLATNPACGDPLVLALTGANETEMHEAVRRFDRAVKGFEHTHYKAYPRLFATVSLAARLVDLHRDPHRVSELDRSAKRLLKEALQDGSIQPEDQAEFADILMAGWGSGFLGRNAAAIPPIAEAAGERFRWLALMLEGEHQVNAAWKARGSGYANTVDSEGWKGFRDHLAKARIDFTRAWELRPDLPFAACRMIYVSLGESDIHEMRLWFDRVVAIQIDYPGAWNNLRWGLRQRWYGDFDSTLALGIAAANTRRYDTDVPRKLFDSISDAEADLELPPEQHIYGRENIWPRVQETYEGYLAEPSQASLRDGWRTSYSIVAFLGGKYDVARKQLQMLNWQPLYNNTARWGRDLSLMPFEVAARTGPLGLQVDAAESRRAEGDAVGALKMYRELDAATNADERTTTFVRDRLATVEMEDRLKTGEWVDFLPTSTNAPGWAVQWGKCLSADGGAVDVQSGQVGHSIISHARVGPNFEVRGSFEVVQSSTQAFQAGLVMGMPQFGYLGWYGFRMKRNADEGDVVAFAQGWSTTQLVKPVALNSDTNSFTFRFQGGVVSATVNGQTVFKNAKPPYNDKVPRKEFLLGLGAYNDANDTVIRYRNVQVRSLAAR